MSQHTAKPTPEQIEARAALLADQCYAFLRPLLVELHARLDRRLVQTLLGLVLAVVLHRHSTHGLLLSELGGYLLSPAHAPAGTKRLSRLLHSARWEAAALTNFLWRTADQRVHTLTAQHDTPLVVWDESVLEKPESLKLEGLGPVRSPRAARLKRIKPGYFNPPGGRPVCVPGWQWVAVLVMGPHGVPTLATLRWWTGRGEQAQAKPTVRLSLLAEVWRRWGRTVIHVWDRDFASHVWLRRVGIFQLRFIVRWKKRTYLRDPQGRKRPAWQITRGKRSVDHRYLRDARRRCVRRVGLYFTPVYEVDTCAKRWLVVARPGGGREPWYLLTSEEVQTAEQGWRIVLAYARRWQIEMSIRFDKSELAFASVQVRTWEARSKLLLITALAYAFLLSLLGPPWESLRLWLLAHWCHRTGQWSREVSAPLYRLRSALSRLWLDYPPPFLVRLNSG
ncbi:MAG: transposase [Acidobacteriota bacterium]